MFFSLAIARACPAITTALLLIGWATPAMAQMAPKVSAEQLAATTTPAYHNAIRLDVGGFLASNLANSLLNNGGVLAPLHISYERQLGKHSSLVVEGLLNGGTSWEKKEGISLQNRYYLLPTHLKSSLQGLYVAPVLGYRAITFTNAYQPPLRRHLLGTGMLLGFQANFPRAKQFFWDASVGAMSWGRMGSDQLAGSTPGQDYISEKSFYERSNAVFDGRLGLGYRF